MSDDDARPSPEALLKLAQAEEEQEKKAKLKIFLGYAAGVGKTYAMLEAARQRKLEGRDVAVAYVESHGRSETDALLEGLEVIPRALVEYQGVSLPEMDTDAVLSRKPQIALVDELAHTNAPGSRHEKRWQDVVELLSAGIDVYTTVNIQHFESLNDVVAQITGVVVRETVPDRLLDEAAEIKLVDISPEELLQRLQEGKVYLPQQAAAALKKFFKRGNLIALRELSLRRAAARVDDQMRAYMESRAIAGPWPAGERLLVCVSGSPYSERLIRTTRRLADELKAPWHALYIDTPVTGSEHRENREQVWKELRLAETLGAQTASVTALSVADAVVEFAQRHNISRIVIGKPFKPRWREVLHPPVVDQIIRKSGPVDVYVVNVSVPEKKAPPRPPSRHAPLPRRSYAGSLLLTAGASLVCFAISPFLAPTNLVMVYLLAVVLAALRLGRKPAILTAFLSVLSFDFFFIPPRFTFAVADTEYLVTFFALFTVGLVISNLVSKVRERAEAVRMREEQTTSLYRLTRDLAAAVGLKEVMKALQQNAEETLQAGVAVFYSHRESLKLEAATSGLDLDTNERAVADWAFRNRQPAGRGTATLGSADLLYLPLQTPARSLGVLGIKLADPAEYESRQTRMMLDAFASQGTLAMERVLLVREAERAKMLQARETLERSLLNSVSHDLRTPLVAITGALSTIREGWELLPVEARTELVETAWEEAGRLNRFVGNLLDMTRLEAGVLRVRKKPADVQDLVGSALAPFEPRIKRRKVETSIPPDLPPVPADFVLITQTLTNLIDNALKYSPDGSPLEIAARVEGEQLRLEVRDRGPGIPPEERERVFDKFYRLASHHGEGGTGLGLPICRGIVEAHGGHIRAEERPGGGTAFIITLPLTEQGKEDDDGA